MRRTNILVSIAVLSLFLAVNPVGAITNGQLDLGRHPYVVMVTSYFPSDNVWPSPMPATCTGTLISQTLVLLAAHCISLPSQDGTRTETAISANVWLEEGPDFPGWPTGGATSIAAAAIIPNPGFQTYYGNGVPGLITHDLGLVILTRPVTVTGTLPSLPTYDMVSTLPMKTEITLVGYGWHYSDEYETCNVSNNYCQTPEERSSATSQLILSNGVLTDEFIRFTQNTAHGNGGVADNDSGAPLLYTDPNTGIVYVLGVVSRVGTPSWWTGNRVDTYALAWIEGYL
jgi:hypothetical protein